MKNYFKLKADKYISDLKLCLNKEVLNATELLAQEIKDVWINQKNIYICGNGGSAANAIHIANDFQYGIGACGLEPKVPGVNIEALAANSAVISCLANDTGYENIFSNQLEVKGKDGDLLIALSGSGNSPNIIKAIEKANSLNMNTFSILGYDGGICKKISKMPIHINIRDMQIAEDCQLILSHICMQWLTENKPIYKNN